MILYDEQILAEALVHKLHINKQFAKAAVAQLADYRVGKHGIPDHALENPALVANGVQFWTAYGLDNPALKYIARVAVRVLGIPATAAGTYKIDCLLMVKYLLQICLNNIDILNCWFRFGAQLVDLPKSVE